MSDTIRRFECPECGWNDRWKRSHPEGLFGGPACPGVPVERTYVAVDALLRKEALTAASAAPKCVGTLWHGDTARVIEAAIAAVTGDAA